MVISIEKSVKKHNRHLKAIHQAKVRLLEAGFTIRDEDSFELGAKWHISLLGKPVAIFEWNVPYMLNFYPILEQSVGEFEDDCVKNSKYWNMFVDDVVDSIIACKDTGDK